MVDVAQTIPHIFLDFMQMREFARDPLVTPGDIDEMCGILAESVAVAQEALLGVTA